ncbi:MAG: GatB/YqeY domain-containing protein [Marinirhabdus sp.]
MGLSQQVMDAMKVAMKGKNAAALQALRAVKSAILLEQTKSGAKATLSETDGLKLLQKLVKQRKESAAIYKAQGREDLAGTELEEAAVIGQFLPAQLSKTEIEQLVDQTIAQTGATGMAAMGKVMGIVSGKVAGRADGKTISGIVKERLSK